jgi:hypothetical protein
MRLINSVHVNLHIKKQYAIWIYACTRVLELSMQKARARAMHRDIDIDTIFRSDGICFIDRVPHGTHNCSDRSRKIYCIAKNSCVIDVAVSAPCLGESLRTPVLIFGIRNSPKSVPVCRIPNFQCSVFEFSKEAREST